MRRKLKNDAASFWWSGGLHFCCPEGCGRCCRGEPGAVYFSPEEETRIVEWLSGAREIEGWARPSSLCVKDRDEFRKKFVTLHRWEYPSFDERPVNGECVFYDAERARCMIYPVRPAQCRLFPFWLGVLESPEAWEREAKRCPGMNTGPLISQNEILKWIRDAMNWLEL